MRFGFKLRHVRLSDCGRYERLLMVLALGWICWETYARRLASSVRLLRPAVVPA
ncbi:MAG TPA: hypothetical protein VFT43_06140 [Candidatus Polarisedimenticolia bacterium]|nr:hypothetical protein [Candidatus Polarisedimenticolia bacterium]